MKARFLKKLKILLLCAAIILCSMCISCASPPPYSSLYGGYVCRIAWCCEEVRFSALVSVEGNKSLCIEILSPQCMSGLRLKKAGNGEMLQYGNISLEHIPEQYLTLSKIFLSDQGFVALGGVEACGKEAVCYSRGEARWCFAKEDGQLLTIESEELYIIVEELTPLQKIKEKEQ